LLTPSRNYILNYLDQQNIAAAKLAGIMEDLGLSITQYNTVVSVLFAGYSKFARWILTQHLPLLTLEVIMQVPSNLLVSKIRFPVLYICSAVAVWGAISACTAAVNSFGSLVACRFMLGFVEAVFFPGAFFYLSMFYTRKQIAFRTAILYSGSQLGNAFGTLLAIGITQLDGTHGLAGWRWLFLIEGILTVGLAIVFACYLPNSPQKVKWLSEQEHQWLGWNYKNDQKQKDNSHEITAWREFILAASDPKTWLMMGTLYATYTSAAVNNFFPTVVAGLGFFTNASYGLTAVSIIESFRGLDLH
jgi:MFS family permease